MRNLILVLGDQLDAKSSALDGFDPKLDRLWMAEVEEEATYVPSHQQRLVLFFSAMRHFREERRKAGMPVEYHELTTDRRKDRGRSFSEILQQSVARMKPKKLIWVLPGDYRVATSLEQTARKSGVDWEVRPDRHFYCQPDEFSQFAQGRKRLRLEDFYRQMRQKHQVLVEDGIPIGGRWNFDHDNREAFSESGPESVPAPRKFRPDTITRQVIDLVQHRFRQHPGNAEGLDLPVTRSQALTMLRDFIRRRLPHFGAYEDAMWSEEPFLYHSRLSTSLNLKLLNPRECIDRAVAAYVSGDSPLNSVEGFVRQIIGWREFIRGVYWLRMPEYGQENYFGHELDVPRFFWDGKVSMECVRQSLQNVLEFGYAHHIHRLMVLGNLALLLGVHPARFHDWHMALYLDAVDWVSLPNTLGMSQFGDGGVVGTKPYVSTGNYIHRMSNFCTRCEYDYRASTGPNACPFSTLYWEFLDRHAARLRSNQRMVMQLKNLQRKQKTDEMSAIRRQATKLRREWYDGEKEQAD